jgi:hypothetical protein
LQRLLVVYTSYRGVWKIWPSTTCKRPPENAGDCWHDNRGAKIRELISHPESIDLAREVLAERFGNFTLEPAIQDGEPVYLAHGKVDLFGEELMARTHGAGGQNRTGYARLFRAALYQ